MLGMKDGRITKEQLTASSCWHKFYCVDRARLDQPRVGPRAGAWSTKQKDDHQYIQIDLLTLHQVTGIITQGRQDANQWVTSFKVFHSIDGVTFTPVISPSGTGDEVFHGNRDRNTHNTNVFSVPVTARFIRIMPVSWHAHISMRFELLGRVMLMQEAGEHHLGLESGAIPDSAFSASSMYNYGHRPANARLNFHKGRGRTGGWSSRKNDANQYIEVDLMGFYIVSGVIIQGREDYSQWVTTFKVSYSRDDKRFSFVPGCDGNPMVFTGNKDRNTPVTAKFLRSVTARYIRIHPVTWHSHISMRFDVIGTGPVVGQEPQEKRLGVEDGRIKKEQLSASSCYSARYCVDQGRLNMKSVGGAWIAKRNDHSQWIQVDLKTDYLIQGVLTQGRSTADQWVLTYKVMFKANSDSEWQNVVSQTGQTKIFTGNTDRNGVVRNLLPSPVRARFVRIVPVTWKSRISMRFELLGDGPVTPDMRIHRLGIEDKSVPDFSLSASSCYRGSTRYCAPRARLNMNQKSYYGGGWRAAKSNPNQWIKVDLGAVYEVTGVITQGRQEIRPRLNQWVTTFKLSYSLNGKDWLFAAACENGDKVIGT
ncbi:lactadherin-like [Diadema antillarum]|uniref:lactadherin-like n=1 Tax=Diadema antillarum TaxID=105358 RepID=UPI003A8575F1